MASEKQKLLVAVDGSKQSWDVVHYVAGVCAPQRTEVTLFHVLSSAAESDWDVEAPEALDREPDLHSLMRRQGVIEAFMDDARQVFRESGFPDEAVRAVVHPRQEGIARDILNEAGRGYAAVAAGKIGHNPIARLVMGSVASKLVTALTTGALWIVDGRPDMRRVLVCIDASPATGCVISHVGRMLAESATEITLFHAIRNPMLDGADPSDPGTIQAAAKREMGVRKAMVPVFENAVASLKAMGIAADRVAVKVVSGVATRGGTIFAQALQGGCGTIVAGRRGLSHVKAFPIGRVPMKLVQLINDMTIWVVNG